MLRISEIKDLSKQELNEKLIVLKKTLFELRTQRVTGRIDKPNIFKQTRKDIARILTVLNERE